MIKVGNHVIIIGGYEDCSDTWTLQVAADQNLVNIVNNSPSGDDIEYDVFENWLQKLPRFTFPAIVHTTYYMWLA